MLRQSKLFEIRDEGTHIPSMAIRFVADADDESYPLRRAGYGVGMPYVILVNLLTGKSNYDPFAWGGRTMHAAHDTIGAKWHDLKSGQVIDVEYELGITTTPKSSERLG